MCASALFAKCEGPARRLTCRVCTHRVLWTSPLLHVSDMPTSTACCGKRRWTWAQRCARCSPLSGCCVHQRCSGLLRQPQRLKATPSLESSLPGHDRRRHARSWSGCARCCVPLRCCYRGGCLWCAVKFRRTRTGCDGGSCYSSHCKCCWMRLALHLGCRCCCLSTGRLRS